MRRNWKPSLRVSVLKLFKLNRREQSDFKFPPVSGLVYDEAPTSLAMLREKIKDTSVLNETESARQFAVLYL
jgi:hypothetical protein